MKSIKSLLLLIVFVSVYGCVCSYRIPGTVVLVRDDSIKNVSQEIKPSSFICSAHTFPIRLGSALSQSICTVSDKSRN